MIENTEFTAFPKMARLSREAIITEKIDGTNSQVVIEPATDAQKAGHLEGRFIACVGDFVLSAGSRNRWITPLADNYGFARWVQDHKDELVKLGPGRHFGEWWGCGIQRGYGLKEKRFSLFNVVRWVLHGQTPGTIPTQDPRITMTQEVLPPCVGLVPVLWRGVFSTPQVDVILEKLRQFGSVAAPGFPSPEGVVVWHTAANIGFKKTLGNDGAKGGDR